MNAHARLTAGTSSSLDPSVSLARALGGAVHRVHGHGPHRAPGLLTARQAHSPHRPPARQAPGPCHSSRLHWWICHAERLMVLHGTPRADLNTGAAFIVDLHESGGNPHARNDWDSNAAAGTPSEGIAQVIGPTFRAYALPGHVNIWNPVDNMVAAFRYAVDRYGSMNNIPGVVAVRAGDSYVGY